MFILSESQDPVPSPARSSYSPSYYNHGGPQERGPITLLKHGYFRNSAIPRGQSYDTRLEPIPKTSLFLLTIINSDGQIMSQVYARWEKVAKMEKKLLRKAEKSIFTGVPYRGVAIQRTWG